MPVNKMDVYDPGDAELKTHAVAGWKAMEAKGYEVLAEVRGRKMTRKLKDGSVETVDSGMNIKKAKNIFAVPIISRKTGEVRHLNLSDDESHGNPGAHHNICDMFEGNWRFATDDEQAAGLARDEAERNKIKADKEKAVRMPAELIGEKIGEKISELAETIKENRKAKEPKP